MLSGHFRGLWLIVGALLFLPACATEKAARPAAEPAAETPSVEIKAQEAPELPAPFLKEESVAKEEMPKPKARRRRVATRLDKSGDRKEIILNFENADIRTVIETVGDILGLNYILGPGIQGQVTIQSNSKFPVDDLFSVFQAVLELNNLTAVKDGAFYTILPLDQAKGLPIGVQKGKEVVMSLDAQLVTQIVSLEYVKASDAATILRNLLPKGADLVVYEPTNLLIITARPQALQRVMKILEAVDVAETETEAVRTFVYYVEHGEAKALADILKTIYEEKRSSIRRPTPRTPTRRTTARRRPSTRRKTSVRTPSKTTTVAGSLTGDVVITAYEDINAIIIKSTPKNYLTIVDALKKLDVPRKQVLIDVVVAEVTLGENEKFGIEWLVKTQGVFGKENASMLGGIVQDSGLGGVDEIVRATAGGFAAVVDPGKFAGIIQALAENNQLKVISSPSILATDTKEAVIEVGQDVPTATGTVITDTTSINTVGQIQYRKTGAILKVTPQINSKNRVTLKISQELSDVASDSVSGINSPVFTNRTAKTTAVVQDGHSLIIGGLIGDRKEKVHVGIPVLSSIPYLGYLFGTTTTRVDRVEFLIIVTPHIVVDPGDADAITEEYRARIRYIPERIDLEHHMLR